MTVGLKKGTDTIKNKYPFSYETLHIFTICQCFLPHFHHVSIFLSKHTQFSLSSTHTITSWNKLEYEYMCVCSVEGIIKVFILWPSVWPTQRASFSQTTVGHWLAGLWNIWITWLAASNFYAVTRRDGVTHWETEPCRQQRSCYHYRARANIFLFFLLHCLLWCWGDYI